ncbi:C-type lectin domain family 4 member E isoform X1 [Brienomyrus brachyistius]|uniref:C-type lectin domain family 4 member E isoform X1 n=1 Tax=Brienomyrus brachyistius TaxID=42636 RepID=UPI0020B19DFC|nr:C-type lectin domain family 4 member E isoform X1 [Brienomyrus brachyistius]
MENYTSLQDFSESGSPAGKSPILRENQASPVVGVRQETGCMRSRATAVLVISLLLSVCANIALSILLYNRPVNTGNSRAGIVGETSALTQKYNLLSQRYTTLCGDYQTLVQNCTEPRSAVNHCKPCPPSWVEFEDKCYYFSKDKLDWESSKASCETLGSHLVVLRSHEQHEALEQEVRRLRQLDYHFWIGLSDRETEGDWKWVDNSTVNFTYWNVENSQPDNHLSGGIHGEDCAVLNSIHKYWADVPCDFLYKHICEMNAVKMD